MHKVRASGARMNLLIIQTNDLTGAQNQSLGVAKVLAQDSGAIQTIKVKNRPHYAWFVKLLILTGVLKLLNIILSKNTLWHLFFLSDHNFEHNPNIIISTLGSSEYANLFLSVLYQAKSIYIGKPVNFSPRKFSLLIQKHYEEQQSQLNFKNVLSLSIGPVPVTQKEMADVNLNFRNTYQLEPETQVWSLLIGGDCNGYTYTKEDYESLATLINQSVTHLNIKWVISSSRRTSPSGEKILKQNIKNLEDHVLVCNWWHEGGRQSLATYIGPSNLCFVHEESISMLSECAAFHKPIFAIAPINKLTTDADNNIAKNLTTLENQKYLQRLSFNDVIDLERVVIKHAKFMACSQRDENWEKTLLKKAKSLGILP